MAKYYQEPSRTFNEYLLIPNLTTEDCAPANISLKTPLVKFKKGETPALSLNLPFASAVMQAVSDSNLAIELAKQGGISFIYQSQSVESQAQMVYKVKKYKAGFVQSDLNVTPDATLADVLKGKEEKGHSTTAVTDDGTPNGKLLGIVTGRDYRLSRADLSQKVKEFMTPFDKLVYAREGISLHDANDMIWDHKLNCLPIIDENDHLVSFVFRKDYDSHKEHPLALQDEEKRLMVGAGINSRDYEERVPALIEAGADILCIDSSDGFSVWQKKTIDWIRAKYGDKVKVGAGNVVDREGFLYLAEAGADFVKVGIGGGSICITRETKGIGRGQASAIREVVEARNEYFEKTGVYVPICSDGGIVHDYHMTLALAMGADFLMLGRYFARFDESPSRKLRIGNNIVKEYWGEGSNRARNWTRYDMGDADEGKRNGGLHFEEGVDSYVPYAGPLKDNLDITVSKIKSTLSSCGSTSIEMFHDKARLTVVSSTSIIEGGAHDVILKDQDVSR